MSGRTREALAAQAGRLGEFVAARPEVDAADVGWSLATTRSVFEYRAVVTGAEREELLAGLAGLAAGEAVPGAISGRAGDGARVGFLFAGQGSQRAGMGRELHAASPVFAAVFDAACALLESHLGIPVAEVVLGGRDGTGEGEGHSSEPGAMADGPGPAASEAAGTADQTVFAQAGLFAVQAGLVALLAAAGITPDAVAGHSVGEVGAAYAAGVLSLESACALVAARARLMQALPAGGAMCSIQASETEVAEALAGMAGVSIAAVNGPAAVVISGDEQAVGQVAGRFAAAGRRTRRLRVSHAFHSHRMDPVLAGLDHAAAALAHQAPAMLWAGALGGELITAPDPGYWAAAARRPVRFADAVRALAAQGISVFLEIGPDATLSALAQDTLAQGAVAPPPAQAAEGPAAPALTQPTPGPAVLGTATPGPGNRSEAVFAPLLRPGRAGPAAVLTALARAHVAGVAVDWAGVLGGGRRVDLPTYAFRYQRYWLGRPGRADPAGMGQSAAGHPLLGAAVALPATGGLVLTGRVSLADQPWLAGHAIGGRVLMPGAALAEMAVRAGDEAGCGQVGELVIQAPLVVPAHGGVQVQVTVEAPGPGGGRAVAVYARPGDGGTEGTWTRHAAGTLVPARDRGGRGLARPGGGGNGSLAAGRGRGGGPGRVLPGAGRGRAGLRAGFQGLRAAWRRGQEIFAEIALPGGSVPAGFTIHPALLDAALHMAGPADEPHCRSRGRTLRCTLRARRRRGCGSPQRLAAASPFSWPTRPASRSRR